MGKKKGKKGGGKKGKGGKKKEPQMTAKEAILAYQIGVIEKKLEDVNYETRGWEEKNQRSLERNEKLLSEQELLIKHLLKQSKEVDKFFESEELKSRDDVVMTLKDKWDRQRAKEKEIEDLKRKIEETENEMESKQKEVDYWADFRDKGQHELDKQIQLLETELREMGQSFDEMKGHLENSQSKSKAEIDGYEDTTLDKQKYLASEKAIGGMDKYSRQEVLDNDWLRNEALIHKRDTAELRKEVENIERENLIIMSELFDCKIEDLKISRQFYLSQFEENENLDETGILEMDLAQLSFDVSTDKNTTLSITEGGEEPTEATPKSLVRPQSAMQKAVEDKVFSIVSSSMKQGQAADDEDVFSDVESTDTDLLDNMFFEEEDFNDYLKLGPLELKLLNISGVQMPIHVPQSLTKEELQAKDCKPDQWPVTMPMLKSVARQ